MGFKTEGQGEVQHYLEKEIDGEWVEFSYDVEYDYSPGCKARLYGPPEDCYPADPPETDITGIWRLDDKGRRVSEVAYKDWEAEGFTKQELDRVLDRIRDHEVDKELAADPGDDDRDDRDDREEILSEAAFQSMTYQIDSPGSPHHGKEYVIWYDMEPAARGDQPIDRSGSEPVIQYITRLGDDERIPDDHWEQFGFTIDELDAVLDAIRDKEHQAFVKGGPQESLGKWARIKGGMGDWAPGTEVEVTSKKRNADGSWDIDIKGPGGKVERMKLDSDERPEQYIDMLESRNMSGMTDELRALAGLPTKGADSGLEVTPEDQKVLKDWRRMAIRPSKNLMETSETTGGDIVPPSFVFPDIGGLLGYTQQKLPMTLMRSIDRMTVEGQNTMALMLNELQKLKPATDHLVEILSGIVEGIDKYDAGSIEGREVARVFRFMADAARFTQGGAELTEQL